MFILNFDVPAVKIDGNEDTLTLGSLLSELIATETEGNTMKLFGWHKALQAKKPLMLDDSDKKVLYNLVDKTNRMYINVKAQILIIIDAAKEE